MTIYPILQELCASVKYFSLSGYELFKLTFKLHSGALSPNSSPGKVLICWTGLHSVCVKVNITFSITFDIKKVRNRAQTCEGGAIG